ncbi:carboxylesterase 1E isoform X4 [Mus caroli]|uniref:Carboxylic ester hydrolase n=1 Tax=Mus caroli TaxID=10089 RepID=A0A6P5QDS2_MUSCR|nr:carboxylesterase 1E isoform X4 [Mus caroli]
MCLSALILVSLAAFTAGAGHPSSPPMVDTMQGKVLGKYISLEGFTQPVAIFLGVPFAKPPLGSLKFAPPQPAEPWSSVKNATTYPPMCSQDPVTGQIVNDLLTNRKEKIPLQFSEDCLYLNIYTPADLTKSDRLPVMVWIHGGGLVLGGASTYDGLVLSTHENVVVVVIQYRLGIWGFFSTGDEHSRGNWGHLDQVAALHWVQDNIAKFGGDPGSVTIFGESAGGESVSVLVMLSPLAKNLFHRAISESGVALTAGLVKKNTRPLAEKIAVISGCKNTTSAAMVHCLRQKTEEELLETTLKLNLFKLDLHGDSRQSHPFVPTVLDGVLLPKMPEEILAEKNFNTVPYIVGINKQEFGWILPTMMNYPPSDVKLDQMTAISLLKKSSFLLNLPEDTIAVVIEKYLRDTDDEGRNKDQLLELIGDVVFGVPSVIVSRGHRDAGAPTYMYEFQYCPSFSSEMKPDTVVGDHGDEIYSVFGAPILRGGTSEEEINLSKMIMKFWANFARNGNPNGQGLPHWPEYDQKEGYLQIGATTQQAQKLKERQVAFWTELLAKKQLQTEHTEL